MSIRQIICCSAIAEGVEVVTERAGRLTLSAGGAAGYRTTIHGGKLDGESYHCDKDPDIQHERVCDMVRVAAVHEEGEQADREARQDRDDLLERMRRWPRRFWPKRKRAV